MVNHQDVVGATPDVQLDSLYSQLDCPFKGLEGILQNFTPVPAMGYSTMGDHSCGHGHKE